MVWILDSSKIQFAFFCFSACLFYAAPSVGISAQPLTEQQISSGTVVAPSAIKSSLEKKPLNSDEALRLNYEGIKHSHIEPANGKIPPEPKDSILKRKHPVDMSTGKELLPMPVEPNR